MNKNTGKIQFDKCNYRIHNERNKELIKKSLKDCGTGRSIVIDNEDEIVCGNGVYEQAKALNIPVKVIETDGTELIAVKRTDLSTEDDKRKQLAVMDNTTSDSSEFNIQKLEDDLGIGSASDFGISFGSTQSAAPANREKREQEEQETYDDSQDDFGDEIQRVIICYKTVDKDRLGDFLGIKINKILYNINEILEARNEESSNEY